MENRNTIVALSTPALMAALAVVRMSGPDAIGIAEAMFSRRLGDVAGGTALHGILSDGTEPVDEVILTVFRAPASYTGEDTVEISCHGSMVIVRRILELAQKHGARQARAGEFTKRAFVNGKLDLVEAEAVIDLIEAETGAEAEAAFSSVRGTLSKEVEQVRDNLLNLAAQLLAYVDYPDDGIEDLSSEQLREILQAAFRKCCVLRDSYEKGRILKNGIRTAICGRQNAGKSTLMNRILGYDRSIVTSHAGTTRDVVEGTAEFAGLKLILDDTAGIRESGDEVEKLGIERALQEVRNADLLFYVQDRCERADVPEDVLHSTAKKIAVLNKSDVLSEDACTESDFSGFDAVCLISAATGDGMDELEKKTAALYENLKLHGGVVMNVRQHECLVQAADALRQALDNLRMTPDVLLIDVEDAVSALGEMTGKTVHAEITDRIFSRFCVGK